MDIYLHLKTSTFLHEKFMQKKRKNPSFSIRSWASRLGMKSHGSLHQVMAGKRTLPKKYIPSICKILELDVGESMYFETLVDFEKAKTSEEKDVYLQRLKHLRPSKKDVSVLEIENYKYFQNPLHSIIRVLLERSDFKNDPAWIQALLRFKTSQYEIASVINRLLDLGYVEHKNGTLTKNHDSIQNKLNVPSKAVQTFHSKMGTIGAQEVFKQDIENKEYSGFCFNIQKEKLQEGKGLIRQFVNDFMSKVGASAHTSQETYQLNVQFFSLTNDQSCNENTNKKIHNSNMRQ